MGEMTKLKILAYTDPDFSSQVGEFDAPVNPESFQTKNEQEFCTRDTTDGSSAKTARFKGTGNSYFELVLFFDGTGVINEDDVSQKIDEVKKLVYTYNGTIHEPNYIKILWGTQSLFQGRLQNWNVNYTMLDTDGTPLRAEVTIVLLASVSAKKKALEEQKNSSDLTHVRTVMAGDSLPLMCYRIYGDSSYYIKVARYNNLTDFRSVKPGQTIVFPPVN
ncbi:LysM peptidoglycan-binding domain-containing protein [Maribellus luteus]|uniref:LysM peptidoglycan-binding domain-containing protein n=2 Tax=Prolixibacteraceae TaxID=1471398 RepID=A0A399T2E9_9BACT|nr:LysM peptidoglycan-binding domain-containing protein [Maribellus luteus]